jgi:hypothetical protein
VHCHGCGVWQQQRCRRPYTQLEAAQRDGLSLITHASALRAYLRQGLGGSSAASGSSMDEGPGSDAEPALAILEHHADGLQSLKDASLARAVCAAAVHAVQDPALQLSWRATMHTWDAVAQAQGSAEALYGCLLPPAQLAAWGLKLLQSSGASSADLHVQLSAAVGALEGRGKSGQLLALLRLLPLWLPGLQPALAHWGQLLCCARQDTSEGPPTQERVEGRVAQQLCELCAELRASFGPFWADKLTTPAKVGLLGCCALPV